MSILCCTFFHKDVLEVTVYFHCIQSSVVIVLICPTTGDVDFFNLTYKVFSKFLLCKIINFSFFFQVWLVVLVRDNPSSIH